MFCAATTSRRAPRRLEAPIVEILSFPKGMWAASGGGSLRINKALSTGRSSPTQLSRQSKSGRADSAKEWGQRDRAAESVNTPMHLTEFSSARREIR